MWVCLWCGVVPHSIQGPLFSPHRRDASTEAKERFWFPQMSIAVAPPGSYRRFPESPGVSMTTAAACLRSRTL